MATLIAENLKAAPLPKSTLIVARLDGRLYVVDFSERPQQADPFDIDWDISRAKILLGKIQQTRTRLVTLEEVELQNVTSTVGRPAPTLTVHGAIDGKNNTMTVIPKITIYEGGLMQGKCRATATNFDILLEGSYILNTVEVTLHQSGRR